MKRLCTSSLIVAIIVKLHTITKSWSPLDMYKRLESGVNSKPTFTKAFTNSVHSSLLQSDLIVALAGTRCGIVLDPLSNSLPSDLSPSGLWEPGPVLKNDEIYQGYSERFALKFPAQCQVV